VVSYIPLFLKDIHCSTFGSKTGQAELTGDGQDGEVDTYPWRFLDVSRLQPSTLLAFASGRPIKIRDLCNWQILASKLYRNRRVRKQPVEEAGSAGFIDIKRGDQLGLDRKGNGRSVWAGLIPGSAGHRI
jgi:hypothetical protein